MPKKTKNQTSATNVIIPLVVIVLVVIGGLAAIKKAKKAPNTPAGAKITPTSTPLQPVNLTNPPYLVLSQTNRRNFFTLKLSASDSIWTRFDRITYEFMYNSSRGPRGVLGEFTLDKLEDEIFLGSESSGKKVYDTGITDGQITLHLESQQGQVITLGPYDYLVGGYGQQDEWASEKLTLKLDQKTNKAFILLINSGVPAETVGDDKPMMVISLTPQDIKLNGRLEITDPKLTNTKQVKYQGKAIEFEPTANGIRFTLQGGGDYLIY